MLKKLVESYMEDQWVNYRRELTLYKAREELLESAELYCFEPGSVIPKYVFNDPARYIPHPIPVIANRCGVFPKMHLDGDYSFQVKNRKGDILVMVETNDDFDLYS